MLSQTSLSPTDWELEGVLSIHHLPCWQTSPRACLPAQTPACLVYSDQQHSNIPSEQVEGDFVAWQEEGDFPRFHLSLFPTGEAPVGDNSIYSFYMMAAQPHYGTPMCIHPTHPTITAWQAEGSPNHSNPSRRSSAWLT